MYKVGSCLDIVCSPLINKASKYRVFYFVNGTGDVEGTIGSHPIFFV